MHTRSNMYESAHFQVQVKICSSSFFGLATFQSAGSFSSSPNTSWWQKSSQKRFFVGDAVLGQVHSVSAVCSLKKSTRKTSAIDLHCYTVQSYEELKSCNMPLCISWTFLDKNGECLLIINEGSQQSCYIAATPLYSHGEGKKDEMWHLMAW